MWKLESYAFATHPQGRETCLYKEKRATSKANLKSDQEPSGESLPLLG